MDALEAFGRGIVTPWSFGRKLAALLLAIAVPTLLRSLADQTTFQSPFLANFPAILLVAVFLGWRWATVAALASLVAVRLLFMPPGYETGPEGPDPGVVALLASALAVQILVGQLLRRAVIELDRHARQSDAFNIELQHRTKNALQIVRALVAQGSRSADREDFYDKLGGRLEALAKANELLRFGAVESCELSDLVKAALKPFPADQLALSGPACRVHRTAVTPLMMAMHELATNASKYGALSCQQGRVRLEWQLGEDEIALTWTESGGPPVAPPMRRGIGTRLLQKSGGLRSADVDYRPDGVVCRLVAQSAAPSGAARLV